MGFVLLSSLTLLVRIVALILSSLLFYTLFVRWRQTQIRAILLLALSAFFMAFSDLADLWEAFFFLFFRDFSLIPVKNQRYAGTLLGLVGGVFAANIFLLFIDYFEHDHISPKRLSLIVGSSASFLTALVFLQLFDLTVTDLKIVIVGGTIALLIFFSLITLVCLRALQNMRKFAFDAEHMKQLSYMQWAIFSYLFLTNVLTCVANFLILFELDSAVIISPEIAHILWVFPQELPLNAGIFLLWLAYARSSRVAFLQPQRIDKLLVLNEAGLPIFSYDFIKLGERIDETIISTGLAAVNSFLKETLGATSDIQSISFADKELMFNGMDTFAVVLFADRKSTFLREAIESFGRNFQEFYAQKIGEIVKVNAFEEATDLVEKSFGLVCEEISLLPWRFL